MDFIYFFSILAQLSPKKRFITSKYFRVELDQPCVKHGAPVRRLSSLLLSATDPLTFLTSPFLWIVHAEDFVWGEDQRTEGSTFSKPGVGVLETADSSGTPFWEPSTSQSYGNVLKLHLWLFYLA